MCAMLTNVLISLCSATLIFKIPQVEGEDAHREESLRETRVFFVCLFFVVPSAGDCSALQRNGVEHQHGVPHHGVQLVCLYCQDSRRQGWRRVAAGNLCLRWTLEVPHLFEFGETLLCSHIDIQFTP